MLGKLFLQFKTCPWVDDSTFILANSIEHECSVKIGAKSESQLKSLLEDKIEDMIRKTNCTDISEDEYAYDIEYDFKKVESIKEEDIEYDFRVF